MIVITIFHDPGWTRALERATIHARLGHRPRCVGPGRYRVPSVSTEREYDVWIEDLVGLIAYCTCPHSRSEDSAGQCWHVAAAVLAEVGLLGGAPEAVA